MIKVDGIFTSSPMVGMSTFQHLAFGPLPRLSQRPPLLGHALGALSSLGIWAWLGSGSGTPLGIPGSLCH